MYLNILRKKIDKSNIISFDIFDTLIVRNCFRPSDVFRIVSEKYERKFHSGIDFYTIRKNAEIKARQISDSSDVTLDDIYKCIDLSDDIKNHFREIELETELSICQRNFKLYEIYKYCKEKNKKIICVSNMYLDKDFIKKLLNKCGYDIKDVYVSCEYGEKKQKGKLFSKVFSNDEIKNSRILHIGDGFKADFLGPRFVGIKSFRINRINNCMKYINTNKNKKIYSLSDNILLSTINNNTIDIFDNYEKIGFELVGPLCLQYITWLHNITRKNNDKCLLFCARDMKMIMDFYNMYFPNDIKNDYFYISRKSTYLPYLYKYNAYEDFVAIFPKDKNGVSLKELLEIININLDNKMDLNKYRLDYDTKYNLKDLFLNPGFKEFYNDVLIKIIKEKGKIQYDFLCNYINKITNGNEFAITDLGWRGTTQRIISRILDSDINGYYFGLINEHKEIKDRAYSFIQNSDDMKKVYSFAEVLELMLSALHGTTLSYTKDDVVLGKSSNEDNKYILSIQKGAYKFFEKITGYKDCIDCKKSDMFINYLIPIGINPSLHSARIFGSINSENYGKCKVAVPKKVIHYIMHPMTLKKDFVSSGWKVGFMKSLLKIKLPYYKIYLFLKNKGVGRKNEG